MESLFKENKKIVHSFTKCATPDEVFNEVAGYRHAAEVGMQVVNILHHSESYLTIERVDGISVFRYLELLELHGKDVLPVMKKVLRFLLQEVVRFQSKPISSDIPHRSYDVEKKITTVVEVMRMTGHYRTDDISDRISKITELFGQFATTPFRDATPKNSLLSGVHRQNVLLYSASDIVKATRHIDFRSVAELTPLSDDFISVLWHYMIPDHVRCELLAEHDIDSTTQEFTVAKFVRVARFWARRQYYLHKRPSMYRHRYELEDLSFYETCFDNVIEEILEVIS